MHTPDVFTCHVSNVGGQLRISVVGVSPVPAVVAAAEVNRVCDLITTATGHPFTPPNDGEAFREVQLPLQLVMDLYTAMVNKAPAPPVGIPPLLSPRQQAAVNYLRPEPRTVSPTSIELCLEPGLGRARTALNTVRAIWQDQPQSRIVVITSASMRSEWIRQAQSCGMSDEVTINSRGAWDDMTTPHVVIVDHPARTALARFTVKSIEAGNGATVVIRLVDANDRQPANRSRMVTRSLVHVLRHAETLSTTGGETPLPVVVFDAVSQHPAWLNTARQLHSSVRVVASLHDLVMSETPPTAPYIAICRHDDFTLRAAPTWCRPIMTVVI